MFEQSPLPPVQPIQMHMPSALERETQRLGLQKLRQENTQGAMSLQQAQEGLARTQKIRQILEQSAGRLDESVWQQIQAVDPQIAATLRKAYADAAKSDTEAATAKTTQHSSELDATAKELSLTGRGANSVNQSGAEQKPAAYAAFLQDLQSRQVDPDKLGLPAQYDPGVDSRLQQLSVLGMTNAELLQHVKDQREANKPHEVEGIDAEGNKVLAQVYPDGTVKKKVLFQEGMSSAQRATEAGSVATRAETARHNQAMEKRPVAGAANEDEAKAIAQAVMDGKEPPDLTGFYRNKTAIVAELAKQGYDRAAAERDWKAIQKHLGSLNSAQQLRLRQSVAFTYDSLDNIEELYGRWKKAAYVSGVKAINKKELAAAKQFPGEPGKVAQLLESQINDLISELGTVYKGGNASTDETLRLAAENLKAEWNDETFTEALQQIRKNLKIRQNSILTSQPVGVSPNSRYLPPAGGEKPPTMVLPDGTSVTLQPDGSYHQ